MTQGKFLFYSQKVASWQIQKNLNYFLLSMRLTIHLRIHELYCDLKNLTINRHNRHNQKIYKAKTLIFLFVSNILCAAK